MVSIDASYIAESYLRQKEVERAEKRLCKSLGWVPHWVYYGYD